MISMFDYLNYKNKIPLEKCLIDIPRLNPLSIMYEKFWIHNVKRKQIEGMWVEHEGEHKWIPGVIFQYVNLWNIEMKKKDGASKGKVIGRPRLRDIEWIKGYVHAWARGFSGFKDDDEFSCHRILLEEDLDERLPYLSKPIRESIFNSKGELKKYTEALPYLYSYMNRNMGKPLFLNQAKNVVDVECRNIGKTVGSGNLCGHNFLTDGVMDFDEWLENRNKPKEQQDTYTTQTLIGASDSKYINNLTKHLKIGLDYLPGKVEIGNTVYPPPLSKKYSGSWVAGKDIIARYEEKTGGRWEWKGSGSGYLMRTFKDNEFAANGTRYGFGLIDEVGFMGNLLETLGQLHECTTVDGEKYGTIWMTGTGGDMEGGATEAVKQVFYSPSSFDCLEFDDIFEGSPKKIGFFVPAWMALDEFRDELGNVNRQMAEKKLAKEREAARKSSSKKPLNDLMQMKPLVPSEAFLIQGGNIFDSEELRDHLKWLETEKDGFVKGKAGKLVLLENESTKQSYVEFRPDINNSIKPVGYPVKEKDDKEGCVVIWKEPHEICQGDIPYGMFLAGLDPYAQDEAPNSVSLGSMQVFIRSTIGGQSFDEQVAEYTGRPETAKEFYENCMKLLMYYNAICLYENNFNQFKEYMQNRGKLSYLAKTPTALKNNKAEAIASSYGWRTHGASKEELEIYTRDWLMDSAGDGKLNLHHIYSIPLLQELKGYNDTGNFDRVIALMLFVAQKTQMHRIVVKQKNAEKKSFWSEGFFKNKRL